MVSITRILHPTDFSDSAAEATAYACAFAKEFQAELHLLHVIPNFVGLEPRVYTPEAFDGYVDSMKQEAESKFAEIVGSKLQGNRNPVHVLTQGKPFVEIIRYAREHDIDLIVMGTHGRSALPHMLLGSVAEHVVRKAACPVLTVRPSSHEFIMP